jgi:hypothetical protein
MVEHRIPWQDRFRRPTPEQLRKGLPRAHGRLFDLTRRRLREAGELVESVGWYGQSWRWAIEYRSTAHDEPVVVLIPCPDDLQMAMLLDPDFIDALPIKRMKRAVRDGLELARPPFDTRWGVWSISQSAVVEDLKDLLVRRLRHLRGENGRRSRRS